MKKLKVAHIITGLNTGGTEMMLLKVLRNASDRYEHIVVSLLPIGRVGNMIRNEGFKVYALNLKMLKLPTSFIKLLSILKEERPHIVHSYLFHADLLGRIAAKVMRVPVVISSLRNENIGGRLRERLLGMTDFCVDKVTAVSQNVANAHVAKGITKEDKICIIYNGIELDCENLADIPTARRNLNIVGGGKWILLTIASLEIKKGHIFLFGALKTLKEKGYKIKLIAAGRGKEEERLREEIVAQDLNGEVILAGEKDNIAELLSVSDVFVLPSLWEGLPNALLEAMVSGVPVVATRVGGVPEVVINDETGLLVEAKDSDALAVAIERLINNHELRQRLSQKAKEYVRKNFNIKAIVGQTEKLYDELLRNNGTD
jgi:glycosyltransferase involved in cell wall biosynthesis